MATIKLPGIILVVGSPGMGKTTFVEINFLHINKKRYSNNPKIKNFKFFNAFDNFKPKANAIIFFDDATGLFSNAGSFRNDIYFWLTQYRHTNTSYIFAFHSLSRVPQNLLVISNFLVLFKTNDTSQAIQKFENLTGISIEIPKTKHTYTIYSI